MRRDLRRLATFDEMARACVAPEPELGIPASRSGSPSIHIEGIGGLGLLRHIVYLPPCLPGIQNIVRPWPNALRICRNFRDGQRNPIGQAFGFGPFDRVADWFRSLL